MRWSVRNVYRALLLLAIAALALQQLAPRGAALSAWTGVRPALRPTTPAVSGGVPAEAQALVLPQFASGQILVPVVGVERRDLRDTWGASRAGHLHAAIDIMAPRGTPVIAAVPGTVLKLFTSAAGGLTVYVADDKREFVYYYAHLDRYAPELREQLVVRAGDILGFVGTTGNAPVNAPHLHFAVERLPPSGEWWKGEPVNPYPILMSQGVTVPAQ
jgi:murein DD-endopeptidase MepM/ murein hydrolase activator NlpD